MTDWREDLVRELSGIRKGLKGIRKELRRVSESAGSGREKEKSENERLECFGKVEKEEEE